MPILQQKEQIERSEDMQSRQVVGNVVPILHAIADSADLKSYTAIVFFPEAAKNLTRTKSQSSKYGFKQLYTRNRIP